MIPEFEVDGRPGDICTFIERDPLSYEEWEFGFCGQREYSPIGRYEWEDVEDALRTDGRLLERLDREAPDGASFDRLANELTDDLDAESELPRVDIGTIALVTAISATGAVPSCSCSGHTNGCWTVPFVRYFTDTRRLHRLDAIANASGCAHLVYNVGIAEAFASSIAGLVRFAEGIFSERLAFDGMEPLVEMAADDWRN